MKHLSSFPGTLCPLFGPQPFKTRPFSSKNKGHLGSRYCVYISQDAFIVTVDSNWGFRYPFGGACPTTEVRECTPYLRTTKKIKNTHHQPFHRYHLETIHIHTDTLTQQLFLLGLHTANPFHLESFVNMILVGFTPQEYLISLLY